MTRLARNAGYSINSLKNMNNLCYSQNGVDKISGGLDSQNGYAISGRVSERAEYKDKRDDQFRKQSLKTDIGTDKTAGRLG